MKACCEMIGYAFKSFYLALEAWEVNPIPCALFLFFSQAFYLTTASTLISFIWIGSGYFIALFLFIFAFFFPAFRLKGTWVAIGVGVNLCLVL